MWKTRRPSFLVNPSRFWGKPGPRGGKSGPSCQFFLKKHPPPRRPRPTPSHPAGFFGPDAYRSHPFFLHLRYGVPPVAVCCAAPAARLFEATPAIFALFLRRPRCFFARSIDQARRFSWQLGYMLFSQARYVGTMLCFI